MLFFVLYKSVAMTTTLFLSAVLLILTAFVALLFIGFAIVDIKKHFHASESEPIELDGSNHWTIF